MKLRYIDGLRGVAIIAVIGVHIGQYVPNVFPEFIKAIISQGARGVQLFYLLSAFTLFLSYDYRIDKEINPKINFFIRRFFRIAPMYYLGIVYYLFQDGFGPRYWLGDIDSVTTGNIAANFLFIHGINPYWITSVVPGGWTISVEMTFYSLIPLLFRKIHSLNRAISFVAGCLLVSIILKYVLLKNPLISHYGLWQEFLFFYFPNQIGIFGLGIVAYFLIIKKDYAVSNANYLIIVILIILGITWDLIPSHFYFGFSFLVLIVSLSKATNTFLINKITIFFGKISFSTYLVHFAVLHWFKVFGFFNLIKISTIFESLTGYFLFLILVMCTSALISWFFYKLIETPCQKWGKIIIAKIESR
jgi:peptidoglycan/LPS O-acetylase OafA/YrhL